MSKNQKAKNTSFDGNDDGEEIAGKGHNRPGGIAVDELRSIARRYVKLNDEKSAIADDMKDIMAEAKGKGFDVKILRQAIKLMEIDSSDRDENFVKLDAYARALGFSILDLEPAELPLRGEDVDDAED